jgi:hypothetical protein
LFDKFRGQRGGGSQSDVAADHHYLSDWTHTHYGVEAYVEPRTSVTEMTVVLVADDGEWTRRRVGGEAGARRLGEMLGTCSGSAIPSGCATTTPAAAPKHVLATIATHERNAGG